MVCVMTDEKRRRRAEASRRNGAKSRGPKTPETQFICSRNSLKHGCYAVVHSLPDEPHDFAAGLRERWFEEKQPQTREEERLVEEMYRADLMALRYHRAMDRVLFRQQERGLLRWQEAREEAVVTLRQGMVSGVATSIDDVLDSLRSLGAGVRSLIGDFEELAAALGSAGCWDRERCRKGVYLLGAVPGAAATAEREEVYRLVLFNFLAMPERQRPSGEIERMLLPENRPVELRGVPIAELLVSAEEARAALREWVNDALVELKEELDWVERNVDAPERAAITEPLAILCDPEHLKRFKAIGSEYRTMQYRASSTFRALRKEKGAEEQPRRKGDRTDLRGSEGDVEHKDRTAATDRPAAPPAPVEPARATEVEITKTVGSIADGPENAPIRETEVIVDQNVMERDRGQEVESGNEPSSGVPGEPLGSWKSFFSEAAGGPKPAAEQVAETRSPRATGAIEPGASNAASDATGTTMSQWFAACGAGAKHRPGSEPSLPALEPARMRGEARARAAAAWSQRMGLGADGRRTVTGPADTASQAVAGGDVGALTCPSPARPGLTAPGTPGLSQGERGSPPARGPDTPWLS
jgi:hypothetical protein